MNKKHLHLFIYIAVLGACTACSTTWDEQFADMPFEATVDASLTVATERLEFPDEAATQQIDIAATGYWTATTSAGWLQLGMTHGKGNASLSVTAEANKSTTQSRTATITISNGTASYTVSVSQSTMTEMLKIVDTSTLEHNYLGGSNEVAVESNVAWSVNSNASWLTVSKNEDGTGFKVEVGQNISINAREAVVTVRGVGLNSTVSVIQHGVVSPTLSKVSALNITKHSATCRFSYSSEDLDVTEYGICYSNTAANPDKSNAKTVQQSGNGHSGNPSFDISDLKSKTTYYVRAYIVTPLGLLYGETIEFTTLVSAPEESDNGTPKEN